MTSPAVITVLVVAAVFAAGWVYASFVERRRQGMRVRLASVLVGGSQPGVLADPTVSLRRATVGARRHRLGHFAERFYERLVDELGATGDQLSVSQLVISAIIGALLLGVIPVVALRLSLPFAFPLVVIAAIGVAGLRLRLAQRLFRQRFVELFPDALDVVVRAVRAGLPVLDAIEAAVTNVSEPVAGEFRRLLDELRIGVELEDGLERAANRIRVNDFRFFAATLALQRRTGGSLADTLSNLAGLIRRRKEIRLKASALTAESRATAYLVGALPFVMMGVMYEINRAMLLLLFNDRRGNIILAIAMSLLISGFVVMSAMIKKALR